MLHEDAVKLDAGIMHKPKASVHAEKITASIQVQQALKHKTLLNDL